MGKTLFDINSCRAKATRAGDLVECLDQKQAGSCGYALLFGYGIFCLHTQKNSIVKNTLIKKNLDINKIENQD